VKKINTLLNKQTSPGLYRIQWNGRDFNGLSVPTGIYFYKLEAEGFTSTKKMLMIK
jgi:flagellar hook assembly protein FlgD